MNKPKWIHKLNLNPKDIIIFYQNPDRFALSSIQKVNKNPTHSYMLIGYLKKSLRKHKYPIRKIKLCKVIKRDNSFLTFLGHLPFIFRDSLQIAIANLDIYINIANVNPVYMTIFAVPFTFIYVIVFVKVCHV